MVSKREKANNYFKVSCLPSLNIILYMATVPPFYAKYLIIQSAVVTCLLINILALAYIICSDFFYEFVATFFPTNISNFVILATSHKAIYMQSFIFLREKQLLVCLNLFCLL